MFRRYLLRFAIGLILLGSLGFFDAIHANRENKAFRDNAVIALAVPTGAHARGQSYQGDLKFSTKAGETITIPATSVPLSIRDGFKVANNAQIKYLPEAPQKVRFTDWDIGEDRSLVLPIVVLALGLAALSLRAGAFR